MVPVLVLWNHLSTFISSLFIQLLIGIIPTNITPFIVEVQLLISTSVVPNIKLPYGLILLQSRNNLSNTQNLDLSIQIDALHFICNFNTPELYRRS